MPVVPTAFLPAMSCMAPHLCEAQERFQVVVCLKHLHNGLVSAPGRSSRLSTSLLGRGLALLGLLFPPRGFNTACLLMHQGKHLVTACCNQLLFLSE